METTFSRAANLKFYAKDGVVIDAVRGLLSSFLMQNRSSVPANF